MPRVLLRNLVILLAALGVPLGAGLLAGQAPGGRSGQNQNQSQSQSSGGRGQQSQSQSQTQSGGQAQQPNRSKPPGTKPEDRIDIDLDHILLGGVNRRGDLVGLHHLPSAPRRMKAQGKLCDVYFDYTVPGTAKDVRTAKVQLLDPKNDEIVLEKFSTLYPESWTPEEIEAAIREAYGEALSRKAINQDGRWQGKGKGIRIDGYLSSDGRKISTAFPVYQPPRRGPSNRR